MNTEKIINSISKFFWKKFIFSVAVLFILFQIIFIPWQYKHIKTEVSTIKDKITLFLQEIIRESFQVQYAIDNGLSVETGIKSAIKSNSYISDITLGEKTDKIKIINDNSETLILKSNILLKNGKRTGLYLHIKTSAFKSYLIPYIKNEYNYLLYLNDQIITEIKLLKDTLLNSNIAINIDKFVNLELLIQFSIYDKILLPLLKIDAIIILVIFFLSIYVFHGYKIFSNLHIRTPFMQIIKDLQNEILQKKVEDIEKGDEALKELSMFFGDDTTEKKENNQSPKKSSKSHLRRIK